MAIKIGLCGTHGSGKSTLAARMAYVYRDAGKSVCVVDEVARSCPHPLRTVRGQEWIWAEQMRRERLAMVQEADVTICDRTVLDNLMYYRCVLHTTGVSAGDTKRVRWGQLYYTAADWMPTYDHVIRLPLNLEYLKADDPIRPKDVAYACRIDSLFDRFVQPHVTDTFI